VNPLESLRNHSVVVADTGDIEAVARFRRSPGARGVFEQRHRAGLAPCREHRVAGLEPSEEMYGASREYALAFLARLEAATKPAG